MMNEREVFRKENQTHRAQFHPQDLSEDTNISSLSSQKQNNMFIQQSQIVKKLQQQISKYKDRYRRLQKKYKQNSKKIEAQVRDQVQDEIKQLKSGIQLERYKNQIKIKELEYQVKSLQNLLEIVQRKQKQNQKRLSELGQKGDLHSNIGRSNPEKQHVTEVNRKRKYIDDLKVNNEQKIQLEHTLEKLKSYQTTINQLRKYKKQQQKIIQNIKQSLNEEKAKNIKLNAEILSLSISEKQLKNKVQNLSSRVQQIENNNKQLLNELSTQKKMNESNEEDNDRLRTELQSYQDDNKKFRKQRQQIQKKVQILKEQCRIQNLNLFETLEVIYQSTIHYKYFSDSKFLRYKEYSKKLFLINSLREFLSIRTFRAQLLFRYDEINPVNFHKYVDGHQNILLVIHLGDGSVIGGFSVYPLIQNNTKKPGKGFLFSLQSEKVYPLKKSPKSPVILYDQYYLIFGNSEITIKSQEKKLFSNFGLSTTSFDSLGDSSKSFLRTRMEGSQEIEIESYQIYKICEN